MGEGSLFFLIVVVFPFFFVFVSKIEAAHDHSLQAKLISLDY